MKQENKNVLGFFLATTLVVTLFIGACAQKPDSVEKKEITKEPEATTPITEEENGIYEKNLTELKDIIFKFNQKETKEFKELTKEAFGVLAELINELPKMSEDVKEDVKEETDEMKKAAEKIVMFEDEEKVVTQVKEAFTAANEAIDDATGAIDEEKEAAKKFLENVEKKFTTIKDKIAKIDIKNYKPMTKELFMDFYSLIRYMHKEMGSSDIMVTKKEIKKLTQQDNTQQDAEQKISKRDKTKKQDKDKKKTEKSSCGCKAKMKDTKEKK